MSGPGILATLMGAMPTDDAVYGPDAERASTRQGLLRAGAAMLAASAPTTQGATAGQALQAGLDAGQQGYQGALQRARAGQLLQARRSIMGQLQPQPGENPMAMYNRITQLYPQVLALGDPDLEKSVTGYLSHLGTRLGLMVPQYMQNNGDIYAIDRMTGNTRVVAHSDIPMLKLQMALQAMGLRGQALQVMMQGLGVRQYSTLNSVADKFMKRDDVVPLLKMQQPYSAAMSALDQATTNPMASKAAIMAYIRAADPNARMNLGVIKYSSVLDPSVVGRINQYLSMANTGLIPPNMIAGMRQTLNQIQQGNIASFERKRAGFIAQHPELDKIVPHGADAMSPLGGDTDPSGIRAAFQAAAAQAMGQAMGAPGGLPGGDSGDDSGDEQ